MEEKCKKCTKKNIDRNIYHIECMNNNYCYFENESKKDIKILKLENFPLIGTNVIRSKSCNTISFYCPICNECHTQERKNTYIVDYNEDSILVCKDAYELLKEEVQ
jgi:hypothetical protein